MQRKENERNTPQIAPSSPAEKPHNYRKRRAKEERAARLLEESARTLKADEKFMRAALKLALAAAEEGEVPVGCVVVKDGKIIARAKNRREKTQCATRHAEVDAIERACKKTGSWRLSGCTLYVTLEPCPMCAGALVNARVDRLCYGASDPKAGATGSLYEITSDERLNHRLETVGGILEGECRALLTEFFRKKRKNHGSTPVSFD